MLCHRARLQRLQKLILVAALKWHDFNPAAGIVRRFARKCGGRSLQRICWSVRLRACDFINIRRDTLEAKFTRLPKRPTPAPAFIVDFETTLRAEWKRPLSDADAACAVVQRKLSGTRARKDIRAENDRAQLRLLRLIPSARDGPVESWTERKSA